MRKRCNLEHFYVLKTFFHVKHFSHVKHFYRYKNENETMHYTLNLTVVNESSMKYKVSVFFRNSNRTFFKRVAARNVLG